MSARTTSSGAGAISAAKAGTQRAKSAEAQARRGAIVQAVSESSPLQVQDLLESLEDSGDIGPDEDIPQDEISADEAMLEMDAEVDMSDDDEPDSDEWGEDAGEFQTGEGEADALRGAIVPYQFEIVVSEDACYVPVDAWCIRRGKSPTGLQVLYELESRVAALQKIAAWLTERRSGFLRTRDLWELGCEALDDIKQGRVPVEQKSFLMCAGLWPEVSESSLSRYIRSTEISWPDGSGPLDILFSEGAKRAWVANAVKQFVFEATGEMISAELLSKYAKIQVSRAKEGRSKLIAMHPGSMDLPEFIEKANMLAGTKWADVIHQYRNRILGQEHE